MGLTEGERHILELATQGEIEVDSRDPNGIMLRDRGFLKGNGSSFGNGGGMFCGWFYKITEAGLRALAADEGGE